MNIKRLLHISRPRFWIYELGPYIIGIVSVAHTEASVWLYFPVMLFFFFFMYPANIYIYGINDVYDYETDKLNPKKVSYETLVTPQEQSDLLWHIAYVTLPFLVYSFMYSHWTAFISLFLFFFFAGFYSAKPIRAKARPFLDSIFSAGHYIATGVFGYYFIGGTGFPLIPVIAGMSWGIAMHAYSAVPDIEADSSAKLQTIATTLGKKKTILLCLFLYIVSTILTFPYLSLTGLVIGLLYCALMGISLKTKNHEELFTLYTYFPYLNAISGMIIFFITLFRI